MTEIEYKVISLEYNNWSSYIELELNKLGKEGWNLVAVKEDKIYIFSREKKNNMSNNKTIL